MKHYLIFSFCLLGLISCSSEYEKEDELFASFENCHADAGHDLIVSFDSLEFFLIQDSLLKSGAGKSYADFLEKLSQPNFMLKISKKTEDYFYYYFTDFQRGLDCPEDLVKIDSANYYGTKIYEVKQCIDNLRYNWKGLPHHFEQINKTLSIQDLSHPYYQHVVLNEFSSRFILWNMESCGGPQLLQMTHYCCWDGPPENLLFSDTLKFDMDTDYHVEVDGKSILIEAVSNYVESRLTEQLSKVDLPKDTLSAVEPTKQLLLVDINSSENTAYNSECNLFEEIRKAYLVQYDQLAMKYYNESYDNLSVKQEEWIQSLLPVHVFPK